MKLYYYIIKLTNFTSSFNLCPFIDKINSTSMRESVNSIPVKGFADPNGEFLFSVYEMDFVFSSANRL